MFRKSPSGILIGKPCKYCLLVKSKKGAGACPAPYGEKIRSLVEQGITEFDLPWHIRSLRRYHLNLLRSIVVQSNNTANTITFVKLSGEEDVCALTYRNETDYYREVLSDFYPSVYREKDFPATALGKLLKK